MCVHFFFIKSCFGLFMTQCHHKKRWDFRLTICSQLMCTVCLIFLATPLSRPANFSFLKCYLSVRLRGACRGPRASACRGKFAFSNITVSSHIPASPPSLHYCHPLTSHLWTLTSDWWFQLQCGLWWYVWLERVWLARWEQVVRWWYHKNSPAFSVVIIIKIGKAKVLTNHSPLPLLHISNVCEGWRLELSTLLWFSDRRPSVLTLADPGKLKMWSVDTDKGCCNFEFFRYCLLWDKEWDMGYKSVRMRLENSGASKDIENWLPTRVSDS